MATRVHAGLVAGLAMSLILPAGAALAAFDPCSLLAKAEVEKIVGVKLTAQAEPAEGPYLGTCRYNRPDGQNVAAISAIAARDLDGYLGHLKSNGVVLEPAPGLPAGALNSSAALVLPAKDHVLLVNVTDYVEASGMLSQVANTAKQAALGKKIP